MNDYQIFIASLLVINFFLTLHRDIYGRDKVEPQAQGFAGVVCTIFIFAFLFYIYFEAGLFGNH